MLANNEVLRLVTQATTLPPSPEPDHYAAALSLCIVVGLMFTAVLIVVTIIRKK